MCAEHQKKSPVTQMYKMLLDRLDLFGHSHIELAKGSNQYEHREFDPYLKIGICLEFRSFLVSQKIFKKLISNVEVHRSNSLTTVVKEKQFP